MLYTPIIACMLSCFALNHGFRTEPECSMFDYNEKLHAKMLRVEHRLELLEEKLTTKLQEIDQKSADMASDLTALSNKLKENQTVELDKMSATVDVATSSLTSTLEATQTSFSEKIEELTGLEKEQRSRWTQLQNSMNLTLQSSIDQPKNKPGVFAHYYGNTDEYLDAGEAIIFGSVITDTHNAYSTSTGCFDPPIDGLYLFIVQITVESGDTIEAGLQVDGTEVTHTRLHKASNHGSQNFVTVVELKTESSACLKAKSGTSSGDLILYANNKFNFITIVLLQ